MKLVIPFLVVLALVGAAGLSSLKSGDYCEYDAANPDFATVSTDLGATPPGPRCVYRHADGRVTSVSTGSWPWFAIALAGFAAIALWTVRRPRSGAARLATAAGIAMAAVGAFGLEGGGFVAGCLFGVPLAGCRTSRSHAPTTGAATGRAASRSAFSPASPCSSRPSSAPRWSRSPPRCSRWRSPRSPRGCSSLAQQLQQPLLVQHRDAEPLGLRELGPGEAPATT